MDSYWWCQVAIFGHGVRCSSGVHDRDVGVCPEPTHDADKGQLNIIRSKKGIRNENLEAVYAQGKWSRSMVAAWLDGGSGGDCDDFHLGLEKKNSLGPAGPAPRSS
jgi:hypothetical protein